MDTNPKKIPGAWRDGYALDQHTLSSEFLGYDGFGHAIFDNTRSELGELLYHLKYRNDESASSAIAEAAVQFIHSWKPQIDLLVPVPPSNEKREQQPVLAIAQEISTLIEVQLCKSCVKKIKQTSELKNVYDYSERVTALEDAFDVDTSVVQGRNIMLLDDLYRSGATLNAITRVLYNKGKAKYVYALTITRTRSRS